MRRERKGLKFHLAAPHVVDCNAGATSSASGIHTPPFMKRNFFPQHVLKNKSDIFFLTIDLVVTLVQRHTLHHVHFFLDFVFH
jgi:hypothetical protein